MSRWKIETTVQQRRIYFVEADTAEKAEELCAEGPLDFAHEEDVSEEIDSVRPAADKE